MEHHKSPGLPNHRNQYAYSTPVSLGRSQRNMTRTTALALFGLAGFIWWLFSPLAKTISSSPITEGPESSSKEPGFSWSQIAPSQSLQYHACFDGFQCARLDVPMDYHRTDGQGSRMAVAVTRLPAKVPVTDPRYGGAILINPGGPGGSGVVQVLRSGRNLQLIVDATADPNAPGNYEQSPDRYFDIIGFDPRGVNNTTPGFSCFPDLFSQKNWELQVEAEGMLGSSADSFMRNWQRAIALNTGCSQKISTPPQEGWDALGEHTNTPPVARDMLEIVERHGEWREKQGLQEQRERDHSYGFDSEQKVIQRTKWNQGREKLLYWGRSYGTVLGTTFSALFPDRVSRVVLDGVVEATKYYSDNGPDPIVDSDAIFDRFALYCDAVGEDCPFYEEGGSGAIKASYQALESSLLNSSLAVLATDSRGPEVVTYTDLKNILRLAVYQPLAGFGLLAKVANQLSNGNGSALVEFKHRKRTPSCLSDDCVRAGPWSSECQVPGQNEAYSNAAILCSDAEYMQSVDQTAFKEHWQSLRKTSAVIGDYWAQVRLACVGWNIKPKWRMPVPVTAKTVSPLLFVSNILDPVTPLASAQRMSQAFPGSVLLRQDSEGHCTLAAPSLCISKAIREYFQTGKLPTPNTVCNADLKPFLGAPGKKDEGEPDADQLLYQALVEEAKRIPMNLFPL